MELKCRKLNFGTIKLPQIFRTISAKKPSAKRTEFYKRLEKVRPTVQKNVLSTHCLPGIENSGTIIVFTSVDNLDKLKEIVTFVEEQVYERNELYKATAQTDLSILPISQLRLLIVHIDAVDEPQHTADFAIDCQCYCQGKVTFIVQLRIHLSYLAWYCQAVCLLCTRNGVDYSSSS
jgi:hypothetical protein